MNNNVYQGHLARKRFSQNFLHNNYIIESIITAIQPQPNQAIVEIGPGLGALTKLVAARVNKMTVIEIDRDLVDRLATDPFLRSKLKIIQQDIMTVDFAALSASMGGQPLLVFGNLPYNISTALIFYLFNYTRVIYSMYFTLQKEIVNRLVAKPNSKNYGRLSVLAQYHYQIIPILEISPISFKPTPKVDSVLVQMIPYTTLPFPVCDFKTLIIITRLAFNQRRKILRNSLGNMFSVEQLVEQGIDVMLRAENLSIEHYCRLANVITKNFTKND